MDKNIVRTRGKWGTKIVSVMLALVLVFGFSPLSKASAAGDSSAQQNIEKADNGNTIVSSEADQTAQGANEETHNNQAVNEEGSAINEEEGLSGQSSENGGQNASSAEQPGSGLLSGDESSEGSELPSNNKSLAENQVANQVANQATTQEAQPVVQDNGAAGSRNINDAVELDESKCGISVTVTKGDASIEGTEIVANETLKGKLHFEFGDNFRPTKEYPVLSYTLPDNVEVESKDYTDLIDPETQHVAGSWCIKDGKVYLLYSDSYFGENHIVKNAFINFDFTLKDQSKGDGSQETISFPGTSTAVTINTKDGNVTGDKKEGSAWNAQGSSFNADDNTLTWIVKISPDTYATDLKLTDCIGDNLEFVAGSFSLVDANGAVIKVLDATIDGKKATVSLGGLKKGDYYVSYKTKVSEEVLKQLGNGQALAGVQNKAEWSYGANGDNSGATNAVYPSELKYQLVSKSGSSDSLGEDIEWVVVLNSGTLKADMSGYVFSDTLGDDLEFLEGTYTVTEGSKDGTVLLQGSLPQDSKTLQFSLPDTAGKKTYYVTYHTKKTDAAGKRVITNTASVTAPENSNYPSGSATGNVGPFDDADYISKNLVSSENAAKNGTATWVSTIDFKSMDETTDAASIKFSDEFVTTPDVGMDFRDIAIKAGDITLEEGVDYCVSKEPNKWDEGNPVGYRLVIQFKDSDTVKGLIGTAENVTVSYTSVTQKKNGLFQNGEYKNVSTISTNLVSGKSAEASYTLDEEVVPPVNKKSENVIWDPDYVWTDGETGAWITTWSMRVNRIQDETTNHQEAYAVDLKGKPVVITDVLPEGASYVENAAGLKDSYKTKFSFVDKSENGRFIWNREISPVVEEGKLVFAIPVDEVTVDGSTKGWVDLNYATATKQSSVEAGASLTLRNSATAKSGDYEFPEGSAEATVTNTVLGKSGSQNSETGLIEYTIPVNSNAMDLNPNGDTLRLIDDMDANSVFYKGSLKATSEGRDVTSQVSYRLENVVDSQTLSTHIRITIEVPDATALTISYKAAPMGEKNKQIQIKNNCQLEGFAQTFSSDDKQYLIMDSSAGTSRETYGVHINKSDSDTQQPLEGATFELYQVDMNASARGNIIGIKYGNVLTTDANGIVNFGTKEEPLPANTLFYFVETSAPNGYTLKSEPTYFMLKGADGNAYSEQLEKAKALGVESPSVATTFSVYNAKNPNTEPGNPGTDNPGGETPGGDNPGGETPGGDNPGGDNPSGDNPGGETPGGDNPGGETPGGDNPGTENPGGDNPSGEVPGTDNPGGENPGGGNPGDDNSKGGNPDKSNPDGDKPSDTPKGKDQPDNPQNETKGTNESEGQNEKAKPVRVSSVKTGDSLLGFAGVLCCIAFVSGAGVLVGVRRIRHGNKD